VRPYNDSAMNTASRVATGLAGIAAVVLLFVGQFVGAIGSRTEPEFDSSTREIVAFLGSLRSGPQTAGSVIVLVGVVAFLAFAAGLRDVLAPADQGLPALAVRTAQLCAVALVVAVMVGGWELSVLRARELDPQIARFIYDQGSSPSRSRGCSSEGSPLAWAWLCSPAGPCRRGWAGGRWPTPRASSSLERCGSHSSGSCPTSCYGSGSSS
jgi:hypothetical protein